MASERETWGPEEAQILPFPGPEQHPSPSLRELIGDVLRAERHAQGRTLVEVAREAAVSVAYLSEVERGRKEVSSDLLAAVHQALGLELVEVLERAAQHLRVGPQRSRGDGPVMLAA